GEADLELLGFDIGAGCIDFRYAGSDSGPALLDFLLAGRLRCGERFRTRELGAGICEKSFTPRLLRPRLRQRGSRGARVDREQRLAGPNVLAIDEMHPLQVPRNPRTHLDALDGFEPANVVIPIANLPR